jgi:PAS domain S-box-containing protein
MRDEDKTKGQLINEISELRQEVADLKAFFASIQDGISILDNNLNIIYVNPTMEQWYSHSSPLIGKKCYEAYHGRSEPCDVCPSRQTMETGKSAFETVPKRESAKKIIGWLDLYTFPFMDTTTGKMKGVIEYVRDITDRKRAEERLERVNRALRTLGECNEVLVRATDEFKLLQEICRIIVEIGGYRLAWVGYAEHDKEKTVRPVAQSGYNKGYLNGINISWAKNERGQGPTGTAIRTGKPSICKNILTDPKYAPWRDEAIKRGYGSSIALPLIADGQILGALSIYAEEPDAFDPEEVKLLTELADDLAYGIVALRTRIKREQAEKALRNTLKELKREREKIEELAKRIIEAQEKERLYLTSEIHDDLLQDLIAAKYLLQTLEVPSDKKMQKRKEKISKIIDSSIQKGRGLLKDIEPIREPEIGLIQAIEKSIDLRLAGSGIKVKYTHPSKLPPLEPTFKTNILRIVQEALMNVRKHSCATEVSINVSVSQNRLEVEVKDNGIGFDPKKVFKETSKFGFLTMQERAELVRGKVTITSEPGKGTTVKGSFPIKETN